MAGDNSNLKACVAALKLESKGLENRATNVKDSANLNVKEMERLKTLLALVEKERDAKKEEKTWVEQTSYDDVYEAYTSGFNHCLCQVLFHCEVHDESIFYIEKNVYNGKLVPINDISEDGAPIGKQLTTSPRETQVIEGANEDEDNGDEEGDVHEDACRDKDS